MRNETLLETLKFHTNGNLKNIVLFDTVIF